MLGMKLLGAGLLCVAVACAQTFEIRGSITEPGVGGIPGLEVSFDLTDNPPPQATPDGGVLISVRPPQATVRAVTDARGEFRISLARPGMYSMVAPPLSKNYII